MLAYVCSTATSETQKQHERKQQRLQSGAPTADALDAARHSSEYHDGGGKGPLTGHDAIPGDDHESDVMECARVEYRSSWEGRAPTCLLC